MALQAAFMRGVNLGKRQVVMSELKRVLEAAGFTEVKTLLASGNFVLSAKETGAKLEAKLEKVILDGLGLKTEVHIRDSAELAKVIADNPFKAFAKKDPSHLVVVFEKAKLGKSAVDSIDAATADAVEDAKVVGREVYVTYPDGIGPSKLKLPVAGTMRNWNTVTKMADLVKA